MPSFAKNGDRYRCTIQCGAGLDVILEFELSTEPVESLRTYALPELENGLSDGVDPKAIQEAADKGLRYAVEKFGKKYYFKSIGYCPNDSKHYDLHARCVWETIRHIQTGGTFRPLETEEE